MLSVRPSDTTGAVCKAQCYYWPGSWYLICVRFTIQRCKPFSLFIAFVKAVEQVRCANGVFLSKEHIQFPTAVTGISALKLCVQNFRNVCIRGRREFPVVVVVVVVIICSIILSRNIVLLRQGSDCITGS